MQQSVGGTDSAVPSLENLSDDQLDSLLEQLMQSGEG
jgi:hypothetical protein